MRLPRLRLPRPRLSLDWLAALGGRRTILYVGYTAVLFVVSLLLTFPHELLVHRMLRSVSRGPVSVEFNTVRLSWLAGYELTGMRIGSASADGQPPYLECTRLWVRPALSALLRGNPYDLLLSADLYGGTAQGEAQMNEGGVAASVLWKDLNLGRYRTLTSLLDEGQLTGRLSGHLDFESRGVNLDAGQSTGEFALEAAALSGAKVSGFPVPDLHLRQTKAKFALRAGRLEVQEFQAAGDVDVQASGHIVLRDPPQESVLNLRATIQQSLATPEAVKTLVGLIPRPPGSKPDSPIVITGTLGRPHVR
ncbi:MAG: type II secretion system protein GspN [Candidatus Binatia bacterium]